MRSPRPQDRVYSNKKYESWVRQKACLICGNPEVHGHHVEHARKNSFMLVPLCLNHHTFGKDAYHILERMNFEDYHNINLDWVMLSQLMEYIDEKEGK